MKPRILLVDDHGVLLSGIKLLLSVEDQWEIVGVASSGEEAVGKVDVWQPDLILMDLSLPGIDGIEATRQIKEMHPGIKVLILTMYSEEEYLKRALQAGASGYVLKKAVDTELLSAVKAVLQGEMYIYPTLSGVLFRDFVQDTSTQGHAKVEECPLSSREKEVLKFIALGFSYQEIADELFVSIKTIETHKNRIADKLKMKKRSDLVRYALQQGFIAINE